MSSSWWPSYCIFCSAPTEYVCSRCYEPYCDLKCQIMDRKKHIAVCKPIPALISINIFDDGTNSKVPSTSSITANRKADDFINKTAAPSLDFKSKQLRLALIETDSYKDTVNDKSDDSTAAEFNTQQNRELLSKSTFISKSRSQFYKMADLQMMKLQTGKNVPLTVTDISSLKKRTIFAVNSLNDFRKSLIKLAKYCEKAEEEILFDYEPKVNELCLAIFDDDGHWYRALCLNGNIKDKLLVKFIDFGKVTTVWRGNFMPIAEELMFPVFTQRCRIKNIAEEDLIQLEKYFRKRRSLIADIQYNEEHKVYDININNFKKILV